MAVMGLVSIEVKLTVCNLRDLGGGIQRRAAKAAMALTGAKPDRLELLWVML